jgi:predicted MFS family arabinose efflux permease
MEEAAKATSNKVPVPTKAWAVLVVVFIASITAPLDMFKVPPLAGELIQTFGLDPSTIGWLMSIFSVMGIILAFPAAGIMKRLGMKTIGIVALASVIVGSALGAMATTMTVMLVSRFIEGVSMGLLSVMAPAAISEWFHRHKRGLALGIWGFWVPFANVVVFNIAPTLSAALGGWRSVWWAIDIFAIAALVLFILVFRMPSSPVDPTEKRLEAKGASRQVLLNPSIWILGLAFLVFNIVQNGTINTFYPLFLESVGYTTVTAASIASVVTLLAIPGCVFAGWISDVLKTRKWVIITGFVVIAVSMWFAFSFTTIDTGQMWFAIVLCGFLGPLVTTCVFAAAPEIMGPENAGLGMAVVAFGQNIGIMIGGVALGYVAAEVGWATGSHLLLLPLLAVGLIATLFIKIR